VGQEGGRRAEHADAADGQKGKGGTDREERPAGERADDLNRELHSLEHALRASLLPRLGRPADLRVETRGAGDREDALDEAEADQPSDRRHEGIDGREHRGAHESHHDEAAWPETVAERAGLGA